MIDYSIHYPNRKTEGFGKAGGGVVGLAIVAVFVIATACVRSEDKAGIVMTHNEPDHLVPVNPYPSDESGRYYAIVQSRLKLSEFSFAKMTVRPSFSAEYGVQLHGLNGEMNIETAEKFFLTYSAADKSIWSSMPWNDTGQKKQQEITITFTKVELPKVLAKQVYLVWEHMLLRTRYSKGDDTGLDGTAYEFGMRHSVYGETWFPDSEKRKSPLLLVELGASLIAFCKASPADRPVAEKTIKIKAELLQRYLDEHPQ